MFPAEFVDRFGIPVPRSYLLTGSWVMVADRNPDRYFLGIVSNTTSTRLMYESSDDNQFASFTVGLDRYIFMPHALYGSLVNGRWFANDSMLGIRITVIEGFMARDRT